MSLGETRNTRKKNTRSLVTLLRQIGLKRWQHKLALRMAMFREDGVYPVALIVRDGRRTLVVGGKLEDLGDT